MFGLRSGRVRATLIEDRGVETLTATVREHVLPSSTLYTDDWLPYRTVGRHFQQHHRVNHGERVYASGHIHTQTIEGFFGNVKTGIAGNYHGVSTKWLQSYRNEYAWRYNHRFSDGRSMFAELVRRSAEVESP